MKVGTGFPICFFPAPRLTSLSGKVSQIKHMFPDGLLDAYESRWEKGFAALAKFKARKGHCRVPCRYIEGKFRLGRWVLLQRKVKDKMLAKRRRRLNAIGFVWDGHEQAWENGFAALTKFKARKGYCRVPRYYVEGAYKLGQWVSVQRLSRDAMSAERRKR